MTDPTPAAAPLNIRGLITGTRYLVMGGTGFLGKVWLSMMLHRFPDLDHVFLVVRQRTRADGSIRQTSVARFWSEVATSEVFDPVRKQHPGTAFERFLREKVTPIPGDVTQEFAGVPEEVREQIRGSIDVIVNSAGVVDFNPPLDYSLNVNAFGMQNLIALSKDISTDEKPIRFLHTSTCYVAGDRTGQVDEIDPRKFPFPKVGELAQEHWSPAREIAECLDLVDNVRHRANDAFRQSAFLDEAKKNLRAKKEPARGTALQDELEKVRRRFEEKQLIDGGTERAQYWGWHNIYTYTKSIGEQILCESGLIFSINRPAVIESALTYPRKGWNEGINTSAPLMYLANYGMLKVATTEEAVLDIIPVDQVAIGMILTLAELLEDTHKVVYQYGSSDTSPLKTAQLIELVSLDKRRHRRKQGSGNPVTEWVHRRIEALPVSVESYNASGPWVRSAQLKKASGMLSRLKIGALSNLTRPAAKALKGMASGMEITAKIADQFIPFTATHNYRFSTANTKAAFERLSEDDKPLLPWCPESIDWYDYILNVHGPGLRELVYPKIREKIEKPRKPLRRHDHLLDLLDEVADRFELVPALMLTDDDGFIRVSFQDLRTRAHDCARRLAAAGVVPGDRVILSGKNHPDWPIAYFGILAAGAVAVPMDPGLEADKAANISGASNSSHALIDADAAEAFGEGLTCRVSDLHAITGWLTEAERAEMPLPELSLTADDLASVLYTSGTTGDPKGVMLTHGNFTSLLASLTTIFPLSEEDRVLSVLPLHHTFEFSCGLLLPLSLGAQIIYLDEINGDRLAYGLNAGRVTAMVGVPALWQLLERRIRGQIKDQGDLFGLLIDGTLEFNRRFGKVAGLDLGRLVFAPVHERLGGHIRFLISGGAALPRETQDFFNGLGLHLSEGYGLTEAAPVLTVSSAGPGKKLGNVGKAIPGVEIKIRSPDGTGVGEVMARGPNVMAGYYGNEAATASALSDDGWLHTGDMGKLDHKDRLILVGRAKEVVVSSSGENIYLDDVESTLGTLRYVKEYVLVGVDDPRGGERLGMLAVPGDDDEKLTRNVIYDLANESIKKACAKLPGVQRPAIIKLVDADLPRTATRKIQRRASREILEKIIAATPRRSRGGAVAEPVAKAVASVAGVALTAVQPSTRLRDELGFDSLMAVELSSALSGIGNANPDPDAIGQCETVADLVELVGARIVEAKEEEDRADSERPYIPTVLAAPMKRLLGEGQIGFYGKGLQTKVIGRANIPANRPTIVVSNHCSHLDMGLVKYSLGTYGRKLVALAAKDYFFEGPRWWVAYFEQLTNLQPIDRKKGFRASFEQARSVVDGGNVVLLFPEGTRRTDGSIGDFKPLVGKLALESGVDILPVHLDGTFQILPKGAVLPKGRSVTVRIGPPLCIDDLRRLSKGMKSTDASRLVTRLAQEAVIKLKAGEVLDLKHCDVSEIVDEITGRRQKPTDGIEGVFSTLLTRYDASRVERPLTWYFSLGAKDGPRWTVSVDSKQVQVKPGRPDGAADCVIKTSPEMITRIIKEAYTPEPAEFFSGVIKTNEIPLLIEFSRVFNLTEAPQ
ncbi:MAG: long-chain acyl-CoA synthetase [Myxococcota bacterium]|jgi:long-chain acyl-CoA synthetase